jgi:L-alanine-DL-glutamate epimerase-like enolase superfamily enzyme
VHTLNLRRVTLEQTYLPYRHPLAISRGVVTGETVIAVAIHEAGASGRGEACPSLRYGETPASALAAIERLVPALEEGLDRAELQQQLPPGAARNAVDCALWDLEAKRAGKRVWELAGLPTPGFILSAQTIGVDTPDAMAARARLARSPLLKLKLAGDGDIERVSAVRAAVPAARLIVDANEAWTPAQFESFPPLLAGLGVELIEQPLPAGRDDRLGTVLCPIALAADESFHDTSMIHAVLGKYQCINIKLDKTGGLTEALRAQRVAQEMGLRVMVGCMGGTSLAMAPALLVAQDNATVADLDAPLLLVRDCAAGLSYDQGVIGPYTSELWG